MPAPTGYDLVWSDEFSTMSIASANNATGYNWNYLQPYNNGQFGSAAFRAPTHATQPFAIVEKGGETALQITMDRNPSTGQLESGLISTHHPNGTSAMPQDGSPFGYYEARLWLPDPEAGIWPAFWTIEQERTLPAAERGHIHELDIVEHYGSAMPDRYTTNLHDWNWVNGTMTGDTHTFDRNIVGNDVLNTGWHTYGMEVTEDAIKFNMDGVVYHEVATPATLDSDLMGIINLAAGGGWPIDPALNNVEMWVDYFRFYEASDAPPPPPPEDDTVTVRISGDYYVGDPNFTFQVDGVVIDADNAVTADHANGEWQTFTFTGDFATDSTPRVTLNLNNDKYKAGVGDRNLYVDEVTFNGVVQSQDVLMGNYQNKHWDFVL